MDNLYETVDVAFITINFNTSRLLEDLVVFLGAADVPFTYSITVVDNHSTDDSLEIISQYPQVQVIRNDQNLGYGVAANRGVQATKSKYICVLNTDVILNNEALAALWNFMEKNIGVGICSPVVRYNDGRMQLFFFKFSLLMCYWEFLANIYTKVTKLRLARTSQPLKVDGITGALLFLRRSCIAGDTLFDEDFFFYYEDTDLSHRWKKAGHASYALPAHSIIHLGGQSGSGRNNGLFYSGKYRYLRKHYGDAHTRRIKAIDYWKIARKAITYRILALVLPTKRIKQKLASYSEYLQLLTAERDKEKTSCSHGLS